MYDASSVICCTMRGKFLYYWRVNPSVAQAFGSSALTPDAIENVSRSFYGIRYRPRVEMRLRDTEFPSILNTSDDDLVQAFFLPALTASIKYDRGVGYFSAGWLRINAQGMVEFARNSGRARWVISPILSEQDWEALRLGDIAREDAILREVIVRNIDDLSTTLQSDTLTALAWLVADGILEFKLALPRNKLQGGEFHDKFGIFTDGDGDRVSFSGSYNDSLQGLLNYESIKIFKSWDPALRHMVEHDAERFERLWNNFDLNVRVYNLPDAARERIIRLRQGKRPYPKPDWMASSTATSNLSLSSISVPGNIVLRPYQVQAIKAWFDNNCRGLLEMATGTGKTITALAAAARLFDRERRLALVVACPYQHLVDQWHDQAKNFGFLPVRAYSSKNKWLNDLNDRALAFSHQDINSLCVITTHDTFATQHFQDTLRRITGPILFIADEVHHLGSKQRRTFLPEFVSSRLALSATPDRWYDDVGTSILREYFGDTVFEFSLRDAIEHGFLTPYYYSPILVELTPEELDEYQALSTAIGKVFAQKKERAFDDEYLTRLLIKRANLLNTAENKLKTISELITQQTTIKPIKHTLFYCAPGQIDEVVRFLGWERRLKVGRFTAKEDIATRQQLLRNFENGKLQALVAMHCLDEGVDVPSTRTAYILASSGNPRQFIQRRGRILRLSPGKDSALIYDLVTIPPPITELDEISLNAERSILRRELRRFAEFADSALNTQAAYDVIWHLAEQFGILDF